MLYIFSPPDFHHKMFLGPVGFHPQTHNKDALTCFINKLNWHDASVKSFISQ